MINDKYKFIYTKLGKAGSTTVENVIKELDGKKCHGGHYHILDDINKNTQNYFKFTFVRNPWARCVSRYFYVRQKPGSRHENYRNSTFAEFIKANGPPYSENEYRKFLLTYDWCKHSPNLQKLYHEKHPFENQIDWVSNEDGEVLTDYIGRLETIQEDFNIVCDKIGIPRQELPHANKSKHKRYSEYYDDETKQIVAEKYAKDIEYFGYKFEE